MGHWADGAPAEAASLMQSSLVDDVLARRRDGAFVAAWRCTPIPSVIQADLDRIWHCEWVFVGPAAAVGEAGDYDTVEVGDYHLVVVVAPMVWSRALHSVCRHRGAVLCDEASGKRRRIVCPYHQWCARLDGSLAKARQTPDGFQPDEHSLLPAHCEIAGGLVFVCVAETAPDFAPVRALVEPYLAPFDLARLREWPPPRPSWRTATGSS